MGLSDEQKMMLQAFMAQHVLSEGDVIASLSKILAADPARVRVSDVDTFLSPINESLRFMNLEIKRGMDEADGMFYYGLINNKHDKVVEKATLFDIKELALYKKIMEKIVDSKKGEISSTEATNLYKGAELTVAQTEDCVNRLVHDRWLTNTRGQLSIGIRGILELRVYLAEEFGEDKLRQCALCSEMLVKGTPCPNEDCPAIMHKGCITRWFQQPGVRKDAHKCPKCQSTWPQQS
eukprot:TRINITY_DN11833_c0_g1_i2.p1 TRINITY_DN11833_c0_g1~~TRINITY_DN11833_c0_g1_i2.p1  ORF type:complete len:236 (-),score=44.54 TRINITY_DN11833_c0_g1_i2:74-781(-)